jgi:hypothetical protein
VAISEHDGLSRSGIFDQGKKFKYFYGPGFFHFLKEKLQSFAIFEEFLHFERCLVFADN